MIIKIGHRGAGGYAPGNTLRSIRKALTFKLDYIEIDVAQCKTGEVVAVHDATVDRTTDGTGFVDSLTLAELQGLRVDVDERIPTLREILNLVDKKIKINIEIKGEGGASAVAVIIENYVKTKGWTYDDFLISSFNHYELRAMRSLCPGLKLGAVVAGIPIDYAECAVKVNAYSIHLSKEFITKAFVYDAHQRGLKVFVYTVNDNDYFDKVRAMGIDGIFTDYPDRF